MVTSLLLLADLGLSLAGLTQAIPVDSDGTSIASMVHTAWTVQGGAPPAIWSIVQTSDGYLWLGASTGLVRFDGVRFVPVSAAQDGGVRRLVAATDGTLWVNWRNGAVSHLVGRALQTFTPQQLPFTYTLTQSRSGVLIAGTRAGLYRLDGAEWREVGGQWNHPGGAVQSAWFDAEGGLWAGTTDRLLYLPAGAAHFVDPGMPLSRVATQAAFAESPDHQAWIAEVNRSAHVISHTASSSPLPEVTTSALTVLFDSHGALWIGTMTEGLLHVAAAASILGKSASSAPGIESFTTRDGLLGDVVLSLAQDREGNIWVGSDRGLERFHRGILQPAVMDMGPRIGARRIAPRRGMPTDQGLQRDEEPPADPLEAIQQKVARGGLHLAPGQLAIASIGTRDSIWPGHHVMLDMRGTIWDVQNDPPGRRQASPPTIRIAEGPSSSTTVALFRDSHDRFWVAARDQVTLHDHGQMHPYSARLGEAPRGVAGFFEDASGSVWTFGETGMSRYAEGKFRPLPALVGRQIFGAAAEPDGTWWLATTGALWRLPPGEAARAMEDSTYALRFRTFDHSDGLPGSFSSLIWSPAVSLTAEGMIWVAVDSGMATLDPATLAPEVLPETRLEAVRVNGKDQWPFTNLQIGPAAGDLQVEYTAMTLFASERIQFRYRLADREEAWHDLGTRRQVTLANLAPGLHTLEISAGDDGGSWSVSPATLRFLVIPAWYQTLWFRGLGLLAVAGLIVSATLLWQRRRHRLAQEAMRRDYETTLTERSRIAQDLHDTLLQGFAGVTLQLKAAELALPQSPEVAVDTIKRSQELARTSLREARERVWEMKESEGSADALPVALERLARERTAGSGIEVSLTVTGEPRLLPRAVADTAFRIGREAVVNAVRHAEARRIGIRVSYETKALRLRVEDDGRGFSPAEGEEARRQGHFGLSGMRDRAEHAGGRCEVGPAPAGGTLVTVYLPC